MKKLITAIMSLVLLSAAALPAAAQERGRNFNNQSYARRDDARSRVDQRQWRDDVQNRQREYYNRNYYSYDNRSFLQQHRDKLTVAGGTVGGAILGSLLGGGKGAAIGAIIGGGGSALYTYKVRNHNRRY